MKVNGHRLDVAVATCQSLVHPYIRTPMQYRIATDFGGRKQLGLQYYCEWKHACFSYTRAANREYATFGVVCEAIKERRVLPSKYRLGKHVVAIATYLGASELTIDGYKLLVVQLCDQLKVCTKIYRVHLKKL